MYHDLKKNIKSIQSGLEDFQGKEPPTFDEKVDQFLKGDEGKGSKKKEDK